MCLNIFEFLFKRDRILHLLFLVMTLLVQDIRMLVFFSRILSTLYFCSFYYGKALHDRHEDPEIDGGLGAAAFATRPVFVQTQRAAHVPVVSAVAVTAQSAVPVVTSVPVQAVPVGGIGGETQSQQSLPIAQPVMAQPMQPTGGMAIVQSSHQRADV